MLAQDLLLEMAFFEDGITQVLIGEPDNTRFRISQHDLPVVWEQLKPGQASKTRYDEEGIQITVEGTEVHTYDIYFSPLRIEQRASGLLTQVINPKATLYIEESVAANDMPKQYGCFDKMQSRSK